MKVISVEALTRDSFNGYGEFFDVDHVFPKELLESDWTFEIVSREYLHTFLGRFESEAGFSVGLVKKADLKVCEMRRNIHGQKSMLLDKDSVMLVALPFYGNSYDDQSEKAFLIPAGVMVNLDAGIWHSRPFIVGDEMANYIQCEAQQVFATDYTDKCLDEEIELVLK